jgi:serine/threonine protein kinase
MSEKKFTHTKPSATAERPLDELDVLEEGTVLDDKYLIERPLGHGGMCVVHQAKRIRLDDRVAIKVLRPELAHDRELTARFLREGRSVTRIKSEHVVRVFDLGTTTAGLPYLVLEYLEGCDLDTLLASEGPQPSLLAVDYVLQAGEALAEAHSLGIVHRDLKPANLFLTRQSDGTPFIKVIDFGIAKLEARSPSDSQVVDTGDGSVMGSPRYMAPEQFRSMREVDPRSDIWALGNTLFELLSGDQPFDGDTVPELWATVLRDEPKSLRDVWPQCPEALAAVVRRCLRRDPLERFATVAELAAALAPFASPAGRASVDRIARITRFAGSRPSSLAPPPVVAPSIAPAPAPRTRRWPVALASVSLLALLALLAFHVPTPSRQPPPPVAHSETHPPSASNSEPLPSPQSTPPPVIQAPHSPAPHPSPLPSIHPTPKPRPLPLVPDAGPPATDLESFGHRK